MDYSSSHSLFGLLQPYFVPTIIYAVPLFLVFSTERKGLPSGIGFLLYLVFLQYYQVYDIVDFLYRYSVFLPFAVVLYACCGVFTAHVKWFMFVRRDQNTSEMKQIGSIRNTNDRQQSARSFVVKHKGKFIRWITMWPFVVINMVLSEVYVFAATMLYEHFQSFYVATVENHAAAVARAH